MSDSTPTIKELTKLRVVDLKQRLASLGISTTGLKAELVKRLHEALMEQEGQADYQDYQDDLPSEEYNPPQMIQDPMQREKELFEQQKEALAFEQVRLLEEEKVRQDVHRIELGKQQQQMLVDREQQQQLMAETQQQMLARQDVEMIERGKQQQQILLEMKKNEELAREHRELMLAETQQRLLVQQEEQKSMMVEHQHQILHQQKIEERQSFGQPPILSMHQMQQPQPFNPMRPSNENLGRPIESVGQMVSLSIEPAMTANIAAATQVVRRIPHSGPQSMMIPLNPVMTSSGLAQPITTMAGPSYLRVSQPLIDSQPLSLC